MENSIFKQEKDALSMADDNPLLVTASTAIDMKLYKIATKGLDIVLIIMMAMAIVIAALWILQFFILKNKNDYFYLIMAILDIIFIGIIYMLKLKTKKQYKKGVVNHYKFYQKYIFLSTMTNGQWTGETKLYYKDIIRRKYIPVFKEAGYLVLYYQSKFMPLYIHLQDTSLEQVVKLQEIFKIKLSK